MSYASSSASADPDVITVKVGTSSLSGWQEVEITVGVENVPPSFSLTLTEKYPTEASDIVIQPGAPCVVLVGSDVVITGYVDVYEATASGSDHVVHISGRGMTQDLVECSAMFQTFQVNNVTIGSLASKLSQPFGISVATPDGDSSVVPQFNVILTETPFEIIERVARWANFLVYEGPDGSLIIARVGDTNMASGFVVSGPDGNCQVAGVHFAMNDRFTEMHAVYMSTAFLTDGVPAGPGVIPFIAGAAATDSGFPARADGKPRFRPLIIVSEQTQNSPTLAAQRVQWDNARRYGRSQTVNVVADSWRDGAGSLWTPNSLAPINFPDLKFTNKTWLIASVTYRRGENGSTADVVLMPKEAFVPAPDLLLPFDWQVGQELGGGSANFNPTPRG